MMRHDMKPGADLVGLILSHPFRVLSVVGLSKNSGKTTTLIHLVGHLGKTEKLICLTSTGRDGEAVDEITRREKPRVWIPGGVIATTSKRSYADAPRNLAIVRETGYKTAMGEVIVVKAVDDVRVILEGPATVSEMNELVRWFLNEGASRVIIDGSIDRLAVAAPVVSEGVILTSGAVLGPDMERVVDITGHFIDILNTPRTTVETLPHTEGERFMAASVNGIRWEIREHTLIDDLDVIGTLKGGGFCYLSVSGAVSDSVVSEMIRENYYPTLIVTDATRLFLSPRTLGLFRAGGGHIAVENPINLVAVTINPHNPDGVDFDPGLFLEKMCRALPLPVFNVMSGV
jgi:hypothetical protein